MEIEISKVWYQEEQKRVMVTVTYSEEQPSEVTFSANVTIFIDWTDSYAEIKRQALEKAKAFLLLASSAH